MLTKITKRAVDAVQPNGADQFLWDSDLKGFGLKVTAGGNKVYILQYRKGGRGAPTRRVTIGRHGALTPDQARKEAARLSGAVAHGADPAAARSAEKAAPTVTALTERFLAEHVATKTKPRTAAEYRRLVANIVVPTIGRKRVRDVTRADISRLHHERRDTPYDANRALAVLSKMFTLAEKWGERADGSNPCRHVERYAERRRERMLSADEFGRLADALKASGRSPYILAAIKLLIFTGARLSEILDLRWEWVDFERGEARLPDSNRRQDAAPARACFGRARRVASSRRQSLRHRRQRCRRPARQFGKAVAGHPQSGGPARCSAARPASRLRFGCGVLGHGAPDHRQDVGTRARGDDAPLCPSRVGPRQGRSRHSRQQNRRCDARQRGNHRRDSPVSASALNFQRAAGVRNQDGLHMG